MAIPKIKATYSLDVATVRALERLAKMWGISKSEVVRRAVRQAARSREPLSDALAALDELQKLTSGKEEMLEKWAQEVGEIRRESEASRRERHSL